MSNVIARKALIIVVMQNGLFKQAVPPFNNNHVLNNINLLIEKADLSRVPVIYMRHVGLAQTPLSPESSLTQLISELKIGNHHNILEKQYPNCFRDTNLHKILIELKVEELVIVGMKTEYCIDTTVRAAADLGFNVSLISDAHTTFDSEKLSAQQIIMHHNSTLNRAFAKLTTSAEFNF
ncbi:isochorismatase family protein [Acinetobacter sp. ANC 4910]|uniref:isochorismatase family protein n=1 Tax=Acinetobacter sp. ANC 4910 TaxID=2529850 RepID=UPI00103FBCA7|nr:isochorismatase family protein [Acinetobacter sp. ANC 4910]TCB36931.1 isochorismatase family protein [Acinetobacter sp. ANC 4910]